MSIRFEIMSIGRKLLFHHPNVDDSVGTYVTDYVLSAVCYFLAAGIIVLKHKLANPTTDKGKFTRFLPWLWPGNTMAAVTMSTYATIGFLISYGSVALFGGLPHQFLKEVNSTSQSEELRWLISWRIAAGLSVVAFCAFITLLEQLYQQEKFLLLPILVRKIFYAVLFLFGVGSLVENFTQITKGREGFNIDRLFIIFMAGVMLYAVSMLILIIRSFFIYFRNQKEREVRWDLILHCGCPWIILAGGVFSYILTPLCSHDNAQEEHGCPLPDSFNHNAIMHLVHALAVTSMGYGEYFAMKRRKERQNEMKNHENVERLV